MLTQTITKHDFSDLSAWCVDLGGTRRIATQPLTDRQEKFDEALIRSIAEGNKRAIQLLFERHAVRIFRFILRFVRHEAFAEDILSEVFFEAWRKAGKFEGRCQVGTWLLAIARNKAIAGLRRRSEAQLDEETAAGVEDPSDNPTDAFEKEDRSAILRKCLTRLSPMHREVIDLAYYHEQSVGEIAQIAGVPKNTIKIRMLCARNHVEKLLKAD